MNLKEFISETLESITDGVANAKQKNSDVAPRCHLTPGAPGITRSDNVAVFEVEFDVAVTATDSSTEGVKAGIKVLNFFSAGVDTKKDKTLEHSTVSRIKFKVPVTYAPDSL